MVNKGEGRPAQPAAGGQRTPEDCPLAHSTYKLIGLTKEMKSLLNQVRGDMGACNHCELREGCKVRAEFSKMVKEALEEVAKELKLASYD
jgi:hypothetical protein